MRSPSRTRDSRYGVLLIDSIPPATAISISPVAMPCAASITAFRPEPHTLLMVIAATCSCSPPFNAACRAGFCPSPAATTLPMMHSSTTAGSIPARRTASRTAMAPSCGALNSFRDPRNFPVAVLTADTITGSRIDVDALHGVRPEQQLHALQNGLARPFDLERPARIARRHDQPRVAQLHRGRSRQRRADSNRPGERRPFFRRRLAPEDLGEH